MLAPALNPGLPEAGVDEAGRGPLAGPVVAAAVLFPIGYSNPKLQDSKRLPEDLRLELRETILRDALGWGVGIMGVPVIDSVNILQATFRAMHEALDFLVKTSPKAPAHLLIDGNRFRPYGTVPHTCVVKGDGKFQAIAAASILAKTFRDDLMRTLHLEYPRYGWDSNKGYPTAVHRAAIAEFGPTPYHRRSFRLLQVDSPTLFGAQLSS